MRDNFTHLCFGRVAEIYGEDFARKKSDSQLKAIYFRLKKAGKVQEISKRELSAIEEKRVSAWRQEAPFYIN